MLRLLTACVCAAVVLTGGVFSNSVFAQEIVVAGNATGTYFKGTEEPPADWAAKDFDDSLWEQGQGAFGYGPDLGADLATTFDDMQGSYASVYLRIPFEVEDPAALNFPQLQMRYDDGFVAYINGVEVARASLTGSPPTFDTFAASHETNAAYEVFALDNVVVESAEITKGTNILAIQAHNTTLDSSDFSVMAQLQYYPTLCPIRMSCRVSSSTQNVTVTWVPPFRVPPPPWDRTDIYRNGEKIAEGASALSTSYRDEEAPNGENVYEIVTVIGGVPCSGDGVHSCTVTVEREPKKGPDEVFRRGDADGSGTVNLTDAVFVLIGLFQGGAPSACPDAADADDSGLLNLTDAVFLLLHLFQGGQAVPAPGLAECGADPSVDDELDVCVYTTCAE